MQVWIFCLIQCPCVPFGSSPADDKETSDDTTAIIVIIVITLVVLLVVGGAVFVVRGCGRGRGRGRGRGCGFLAPHPLTIVQMRKTVRETLC